MDILPREANFVVLSIVCIFFFILKPFKLWLSRDWEARVLSFCGCVPADARVQTPAKELPKEQKNKQSPCPHAGVFLFVFCVFFSFRCIAECTFGRERDADLQQGPFADHVVRHDACSPDTTLSTRRSSLRVVPSGANTQAEACRYIIFFFFCEGAACWSRSHVRFRRSAAVY